MDLSYSTPALARPVAGEGRTVFQFPMGAAFAMLLGRLVGSAQDFDVAMASQ